MRFYVFLQQMKPKKKDIRALTKEQLRDFFVANGDKSFRGNQVYEWLWGKVVHSFEDMTNISLTTREVLQENFVINHIEVDNIQRSKDGTVKNAVRLHDGLVVESVLIPTNTRTTACWGSQSTPTGDSSPSPGGLIHSGRIRQDSSTAHGDA